MSFPIKLSRLFASAALAAAMLLALAPQPAFAHGVMVHSREAVSLPSDAPVVAAQRIFETNGPAAGLSRSCPGGPGNACCCSKQPASPGSGKTPIVSSGGWNMLVSLAAGRASRLPDHAEPAARLPYSFAFSRAPPIFS